MKFINKIIIFVLLSVMLFILLSAFKKNFNLYHVETTPKSSKITINFLVPMIQDELTNHIKWISDQGEIDSLNYSLKWFNSSIVCIEVIENAPIKGNNIKLFIENAPTQINTLFKSEHINIPFKTEVMLIGPPNNTIISSTEGFIVHFNTPINIDTFRSFIHSNAEFNIEPVTVKDSNNNNSIDLSKIKFTPKTPLNNGTNYLIRFKKGLPSINGELLKNDTFLTLSVDDKPTIIDSYPKNNSKWIGLYPRFTINCKTNISEATMIIDDTEITGEVSSDRSTASFTLNHLLQPNKSYNAVFKVKSASSEISDPYKVTFSTTSINSETIWLKIMIGNDSYVECYKGNRKINAFSCSIGDKGYVIKPGTYYLQHKSEVYLNSKGIPVANYWLEISKNYGLHGYIRDEYWNVNSKSYYNNNHENIILSDSDMEWLYKNLSTDTMVILKKY